ncbi:uncharacterized membrane protein YhaH (DUF805 family) [Neorhizobium huautlense]|uniref:Uncharacterized membrane protein YhaH (DUF805 family) n=1 Tax=Neorhizobium huautlense TaxID=67774 RepID=A0ABT9PWS1_9HYPH|nr:hypothetical protein [Neorhizobium huautlense]MDP9838563.1 uncharacterized membrane protein YhaH (DUF805 family) [Neorhizobium huautlense]
MAGKSGGEFQSQPAPRKLLHILFLYCLVTAIAILASSLPNATDYVGADNDDIMRLVVVRDWLGGQAWFDTHQYRLGLDGGTLMHWSRFVDLPIGAMIRFFSLFVENQQAEMIALAIWPVFMAVLFLTATGIAARRIGDGATIHIALGLAAIFVYTSIRFHPGSIDHHNVQMVLIMTMAAMLVDPLYRARSYVFAGVAAALAIAIGAETVPMVAIACLCVTLQWVWHGHAFRRAAQAFGLSLAVSVTLAFFATTPAALYSTVTCDNLSIGFQAPTALGGTGLFLCTLLPASAGRGMRIGAMLMLGVVVLVATKLIAPECLGSPLANLDPMLVKLWLNHVGEAQSILAEIRQDPYMVGVFYAVGLLAIAVCGFEIMRGERTEFHLIMLGLIGTAWGVALIQLRSSFFSNALSILPLAVMITGLRRHAGKEPENMNVGLAYIVGVLASVPVVWGVAGMVAQEGVRNSFNLTAISSAGAPGTEAGECGKPDEWQTLAAQPPGLVVSPSNSGAEILRFTHHRAISAPYHRNQGGMLTELHIGLATPAEAEAFFRGAGVSILAFCQTDPQTKNLIDMKPDGLYAAIAAGNIPAYLEPLPSPEPDGFRFFRFTGQ